MIITHKQAATILHRQLLDLHFEIVEHIAEIERLRALQQYWEQQVAELDKQALPGWLQDVIDHPLEEQS